MNGRRTQRAATEQKRFLQIPEQPRTRLAARDSFHFIEWQLILALEPVGKKTPAREMPRDDEHVATDTLGARLCQPIRPPRFHELDELESVPGQAALEYLLFIRRVHRDRANRGLARMTGLRSQNSQPDQEDKPLRLDGDQLEFPKLVPVSIFSYSRS
ncbi:MAG TPA: hypothetical protein VLA37_13270, partial [Sphingomonadaceae bacterium]|nr:hypothetical protein [Sphingomonadaceae bacterium]